jgi:L-iditol 2-dehydrogenase
MKAAVFHGPLDLRIEDQNTPIPGSEEIVVKVEISGLCPSEVRIYKNGSSSVKPPVTLGHEFSGYVHEVGSAVEGITKGEKVNVAADSYCGACTMCKSSHENLCERSIVFGYNTNGGHADYVKVPKRFVARGGVFKLPPEAGFEETSMTEPVACSLNTIETLGTQPGKTVAVIGDGPMGILHVGLAKLYGADQVFLAGLVDWKMKIGKEFGANVIVNTREEDPADCVLKETEGKGADVVVVTAVTPQTIQQGLKMASRRGYVSIFGGTPKGVTAQLEPNIIHYNELFLTGNFGYSYAQYGKAFNIIANRKLPVKSLVSHRFSLDKIQEAIKVWDDKEKSMKILLTR